MAWFSLRVSYRYASKEPGAGTTNEAFQRKLDHQMSLHANVPKVFCAVVSNVAQAIGKARGF